MIEPTEEQAAIRDMTRAFAAREIAPYAAEWDRTSTMPLETLRRLGALGLFGVTVPEAWGGAGADFMSFVLVLEELAYGDAGICNTIAATNAFSMRLAQFGSDDQKERFLRPVATGQELGCMALTEPQTGSDAGALATRATRQGDGWTIDGTKSLITSARSAGTCVVIAVTDPAAGKRGISAFLVRTDTPGFTVTREERKLGQRTSETCQVALEGVQVSDADLLGERGAGLRVAFAGLESGRTGVAAQALGVARAAFDAARAYARERETFGRKLIDHQAVAFQLAEMATDIEAARRLCYHAAALRQAGGRSVAESSMAKLFAAQMCERVCSAAIQIHGGYGYTDTFPVEKFYRDQRVFQIYDGTNEVQKMVIARELAAAV